MFDHKEAVLWKEWTLERGRILKDMCEVCGGKVEDEKAVGHHICGRNLGLSRPEFLEFRHCECEAASHKKYPGGNVPFEDRPDSVKLLYVDSADKIHLTQGLHTPKNFSPKFYNNRAPLFARECIHSPKMARKIARRAPKRLLSEDSEI